MALLSRFRRKTVATHGPYPLPDYPDAWRVQAQEAYVRVLGMSVADMWRTQPYLRTVVSFIARNVAQLGLHIYQRVDDTDRKRIDDGELYSALRRPNSATTAYELVYGLVADLALHDVSYWLIASDPATPILRLPPTWVVPKGGDMLTPDRYEVRANDKGESVIVDPADMLPFHGWHPYSLQTGSTPVAALRSILAEQVQSAAYREAVWQRGGKVGAIISRPADAPQWSDTARERFKQDWQARYTGDGNEVGGTPILEDGMTLNRVDFSAKEMEYIDGARLALNTVASVYHINPTMVGDLTNANYSNVREFRRMLYGDSLGPVLAQIEDRLNAFLVPRFDARDDVYVEFNIAEKLQGSFEEQAAVLSTSVGAPWMLRNEARAKQNLPALDDGDELVVPLNVTTGGLSSPRDTAPTGPPQLEAASHTVSVKARSDKAHEQQAWDVLARYFRRQGAAVRARLGNGQPLSQAFDTSRWDKELTDELLRLAHLVTNDVAAKTLRSIALNPELYDTDRTLAFLRSVSERMATNINATTHDQLGKAVAADDADAEVARVFEVAAGTRAARAATTTVTTFSGFATQEAAKQGAGTRAHKTWLTTSNNPRPTHAAINGETVPLDSKFSNGLMWPGDAEGNASETSGCECELVVSVA